MKKASASPDMDYQTISSLGGVYLAKVYNDAGNEMPSEHTERMSWTLESILGDVADEHVSLMDTGNICPRQLIGIGVDFALEAADIIRTKPGPVAIMELGDLVTSWQNELRRWSDGARSKATLQTTA
jgi:hypothetical protein